MFERFTDRARRVVVQAQQEARALGHNYISTEHLLLGLIREGNGVGAKALESLGVRTAALRERVEEVVGAGDAPRPSSGHIPFTPRAKQVLRLSLTEALRFGHNYIGTEHLLLALIQERDGVAGQVLAAAGADLGRARAEVVRLLAEYQRRQEPAADGGGRGDRPGAGRGVGPDGDGGVDA
jgi:ATP-dependent Clp protease ATP-binding subunit ClpC